MAVCPGRCTSLAGMETVRSKLCNWTVANVRPKFLASLLAQFQRRRFVMARVAFVAQHLLVVALFFAMTARLCCMVMVIISLANRVRTTQGGAELRQPPARM